MNTQTGEQAMTFQPSNSSNRRTPKTTQVPRLRKLYVLDTNVLIHDPSSLLRFEEHDIYIPIIVLEELDSNKKGQTEVARNSRATSRFIEALIQFMEKRDPRWTLNEGLPLEHTSGGTNKMGRIFIQTESETANVERRLSGLEKAKADNYIIGAVRMLRDTRRDKYDEVILVSKDINVRIKARGFDLRAEDYTNDLVETDADKNLYSGMTELPPRVWEGKTELSPPSARGDTALYELTIPKAVTVYTNQLVTGADVTDCIVKHVNGSRVEIQHCHNYIKDVVFGISARNREQSFLLNLLMDPEIDFVTILGGAGTGKTLLTIAAALAQKNAGIYNGIVFTRATIPVGEDIGFLPGGEEDKMGAWTGAIDDNLEVIVEAISPKDERGGQITGRHHGQRLANKFSQSADSEGDDSLPVDAKLLEKLKRQIKIKATTFMRGRTFQRKFFILDEAQNLTPDQMKTLVTRAGPGTKIVCLGNLDQIDTPYLTESSSGLAVGIERFKGWEHNGHVTLVRGERSRLAEYAVKVL